ncbi:AP-3 complex subunit beta-2 [Selaginella moellendorffii]|uniref:AP-3 complex subunit beta-2 n=1 Tax=Selaginella moellendorffii TaxID=88036 RepID=UPI000D1C7146|nr:AP-3 complex subunit beta-2 [Selaginella moellendorffii]XP_024544043.1 AP-3 complex subunit beta-2 [Selaginella moellendorffii]|eukprot:XP_024544042.1 AP-3 complex subunit beta-2 [Selaginella moellendorffii]
MFSSTASSISKMSALVSGVGTDAAIYDDPQDADIPTLLDSRYDADKAQGLKRLIALMAQGQDVSTFFPQVVKGVASQSLEVKKLVYIYLVHYADKRPDEALLSINSFQRDLSDINPLVRAWALRAMSGIKVRAVGPLVIMAANKCARDPSPYVRRCAANAVSKIHSMGDEQHFDELVQLVSILLNDNYPGVAGAAAQAFISVCPERYSLLSSSFRKLCGLLYEADEWGRSKLDWPVCASTVFHSGYMHQGSSQASRFSVFP